MTGDRDVRGFDRDCRRAEELLGLLVLDRTTPDETDWANRHLAGCASCRAAYGYIAVVPQYLGLLTIEEVERLVSEADGEGWLMECP
jgi:predicted anti-sigma-YlaC factor YlaD